MRLVLVAAAALALTGCGGGSGGKDEPVAEYQAVVVHLDPSRTSEDWAVSDVEDPLETAIADAGVGEYDGNEIALDGSEVVLYAYGPDADALWRVMEPIVRDVPPGPGSYAIKYYGEFDDPNTREERVEL